MDLQQPAFTPTRIAGLALTGGLTDHDDYAGVFLDAYRHRLIIAVRPPDSRPHRWT